MFRQYQKLINSVFSVNEELFYRIFGFRSNSGYWNLPILSLLFFSVILILNEIGGLLAFLINIILVIIFIVTWLMYRDDSIEYREVSTWKLIILSLVYHLICITPFIFLMYIRGHL